MKKFNTILIAALLGASAGAAMAAETSPATDRDQRMGEALQRYRDASPADKNPNPGPFARAEESVKHGARRSGHAVKHGAERTGEAIKSGAHRTGEAVENGARKAGHAVGTGAEKTGEAVSRVGEKIKGSTSSTQ